MNLARTCKHLFATSWGLRRVFNPPVIDAIEGAIRDSEKTHGGEIRVAIENELEFVELWHDVTPRERAIDVFARLRVWDTQLNNGVLIYVLWVDHDVEIVADRAYRDLISDEQWREVCQRMQQAFAAEHPQQAMVEGVQAVGRLIAQHFPLTDRNEQPDRPVLL